MPWYIDWIIEAEIVNNWSGSGKYSSSTITFTYKFNHHRTVTPLRLMAGAHHKYFLKIKANFGFGSHSIIWIESKKYLISEQPLLLWMSNILNYDCSFNKCLNTFLTICDQWVLLCPLSSFFFYEVTITTEFVSWLTASIILIIY